MITIYDFFDRPTNIPIEVTEIKTIIITILSGDEIADIITKDNKIIHTDSCFYRENDHYDGMYIITEDDIEYWNNFTKDFIPTFEKLLSYERLKYMSERNRKITL